jgi:hypothetical protein
MSSPGTISASKHHDRIADLAFNALLLLLSLCFLFSILLLMFCAPQREHPIAMAAKAAMVMAKPLGKGTDTRTRSRRLLALGADSPSGDRNEL